LIVHLLLGIEFIHRALITYYILNINTNIHIMSLHRDKSRRNYIRLSLLWL